MEPTEKVTSTQRVLDAISELHMQEQPATRYSVQELTGLSLCKVDDRIKALLEREQIKRIQRGQYVPVEKHPPARSISKTILADGYVKIEIGDEVLTLTPREDRMLATLMQGAVVQAQQIESGRNLAELTTTVETRLARIERQQKDNPTSQIAAQLAESLRTMQSITAATKAHAKNCDQGQLNLD